MKTKLLHGILSYLSGFILLCLGVICGMFCLISGLHLPVDSGAIIQFGILLCAVAALIWSLPKFRFLIVFLILIPIAVFLTRNVLNVLEGTYSTLINGGAVVGSTIIMAYREVFPFLAPSYPIAFLTEPETIACATWFCLTVMALLSLFLGWTILHQRSLWLAVAGTLPLLLLPMGITKIPATLPLIGVLTCWLVLFLARILGHKERWAYTKLALALLPLCLIFLSTVSLLIPKGGTETRPDVLTEIRTELVGDLGVLSMDLLAKSGFGGFTIGSIADQSTEVQFSQIGSLIQTSDTLFTVTTTSTEPLYLRRLSMGAYDGTGWSQLANDNSEALSGWAKGSGLWTVGSVPYSVNTQSISPFLSSSYAGVEYLNDYQSMTIFGSDSSFLYTTYQTIPILTGYQERQQGISIPNVNAKADSYYTFLSPDATDSGTSADTAGQYTIYFLPADSETVVQQIDVQEGSLYRDIVFHNYTDLSACSPEELTALQSLLATVDFSGAVQSTVPQIEAAKRIVTALQSVTEYDLHVNAVSNDFALNFLKTGKGYCVHYATTAALLLRAYGIPTRYVTGFLVNPADADDNGVISVRGKTAHAWVEIFIDGYGWYPIEATPSGGLSTATSETSTEAEATLPETQTSDNTATEPSPSQTQTPSSQTQATASNAAKGASNVLPLLILIIPSFALLLIGGLLLRRSLAKHRRKKRFSGQDPNRNAIALWIYLQTLSRYYDMELSLPCEALAKKAMFSQHALTQEEVEILLHAVLAAVKDINSRLSVWGKFVLRYIRGLD